MKNSSSNLKKIIVIIICMFSLTAYSAPKLIIETVSCRLSGTISNKLSIKLNSASFSHFYSSSNAVLYVYHRQVGSTTWNKIRIQQGTSPSNPINVSNTVVSGGGVGLIPFSYPNGTNVEVMIRTNDVTNPEASSIGGVGSNKIQFKFNCAVSIQPVSQGGGRKP